MCPLSLSRITSLLIHYNFTIFIQQNKILLHKFTLSVYYSRIQTIEKFQNYFLKLYNLFFFHNYYEIILEKNNDVLLP